MKELETLYRDYFDKLYAYCLTLTRDPAEAEELAQETFCRAVTQYGKFRGESDAGSWLCAIAKNRFLTELRKKRRRPLCSPPPDPLGGLEDADDSRRILIAANRLEEPYRGVFIYRVVGNMSNQEIGRLYQRNANWAYVTFHRAKLKIIEILEDL